MSDKKNNNRQKAITIDSNRSNENTRIEHFQNRNRFLAIFSPCSSYSFLLIHIELKVPQIAKIEPPIHVLCCLSTGRFEIIFT
jgi:hypothetical protein